MPTSFPSPGFTFSFGWVVSDHNLSLGGFWVGGWEGVGFSQERWEL